MPSRIRLGGRILGTGKYGGEAKCLCGEPVAVLGRCLECHDALRRRRLGMPPRGEAEAKRLAAYLEQHQAQASRCAECGMTSTDHHPHCRFYGQ